MNKSGFTLIELMVAMVVGLTAISSVYALGAAMSKQFYEEQRVATAQGASRVALMELRRDVSRAGLFGTPNANLEPTCDPTPPTLPRLGGGAGPLGAFQFYADQDTDEAFGSGSPNTGSHADRLRVLTSLYLTDQLLVASANITGNVLVLQGGNQAYRRTFAWGQTAGPFKSDEPPTYLDQGTLAWDSAWAGETASWNGIGQKGARAFQTGSVLHIETPEGRHFFRSVFSRAANTEGEIRIQINDPLPLPIGTACLPGAAEGSTLSPLQWVEYAVVDPFDQTQVGSSEFFNFNNMFFIDAEDGSPTASLLNTSADDLLESPNRVLVRRILNSLNGNIMPNTTQVIAEFVTNFNVEFVVDTNTIPGADPVLAKETGTAAQTRVNGTPEKVRSVIIHLGVRNPLEDASLPFQTNQNTRFEADDAQKGSARVRNLSIEIPVMNVSRRNL